MSPGLDVAGGHLPPAPPDTFRTGISAAVQAGLGGPRWAIDISNILLAKRWINPMVDTIVAVIRLLLNALRSAPFIIALAAMRGREEN